ncbi:hypothetical protein Tco_0347700 [Tanacetum coccineum]
MMVVCLDSVVWASMVRGNGGLMVVDLNGGCGRNVGFGVVTDAGWTDGFVTNARLMGSEDWNSLEYQDTANSGGKKETKAMVFHKMDTEEVSDRFVAPCFVNGLEAYDGEISLGVEVNMISNNFAVKLCLEHEVKRGNKVVKKELIVALRGEIYFVKFIINPEEDDVEPGVIFGRSFLRLTKAITDFRAGTITIYPELDPFLDDFEKTKKSMDDWDQLLDFNFDDISLLNGKELSSFVCKMGKEEAAKEALTLRISQRIALLEEVRPVLETMVYNDKYKKVLDEIWKDRVEFITTPNFPVFHQCNIYYFIKYYFSRE